MEARNRCNQPVTKCSNKYWIRPVTEISKKKVSTYYVDFTVPIRNSALFNYYMANYSPDEKRNRLAAHLRCEDPSRELWKFKDMRKSGVISSYDDDYKLRVPDATKYYMDNYGPGKPNDQFVQHDFPCSVDTKHDKITLREVLVDLYANRFGSYQKELKERNQPKLLASKHGQYSGLRIKKYFINDLEY